MSQSRRARPIRRHVIVEPKGIDQALYPSAEVGLPDASYDTVIAVGVLIHGHAPTESLDGIFKLPKRDGIIIFSLSQIA